ncbi:tRNA uridine-5-carboxymethylaminomethyl(34) synthesis GTPase MnmE [uncultured Muribaculum sp.]|uniref:tRNA uridine-5-carboxymethylaminomethyl(34) synthesis GTPase MnmE n=1 Tax=uncultured Muribaculum sp. TaxID=1918613 RepID=UPI0025E1BBF4|nr:tRNA uridine-5-carboxymethylaminomethyl(34) synthesis GTPase MnmE [uncultured Muribaculum sp.]
MSTICAISTPGGVGGLAVVRISGNEAIEIVGKIWRGKALVSCDSHTAHLGWVTDSNGERLDQGVATIFRGPHSFTGEDVVELSVHGSVYVQHEILNALVVNGCRMAEPGEFTRRAFASGRIDLAEAEAVADMIACNSRASHRLALSQLKGDFSKRIAGLRKSLLELASLIELELDFSDQELEFASRERLMEIAVEVRDVVSGLASTFRKGQAFREGIPTVIVGATNVGKSTLLNRLLHDNRAIVSDIHGTTRDTIEDTAEIEGVTFRFIDTAGLRETDDTIEEMGIERTLDCVCRASIIVLVADMSRPHTLGEAWYRVASALCGSNGGETNSNDIQLYQSDCAIRYGMSHHDMNGTIPYPTLLLLWNKADIAGGNNALSHSSKDASGCSLSCNGHDKIRTVENDIEAFCREHEMQFYQTEYSAKNGQGGDIESLLLQCAGTDILTSTDVVVTNARHYQSLTEAHDAICRVIDGLSSAIPPEFIAQDLRHTLNHLGEITGTISTLQILSSIFSRFCIGK